MEDEWLSCDSCDKVDTDDVRLGCCDASATDDAEDDEDDNDLAGVGPKGGEVKREEEEEIEIAAVFVMRGDISKGTPCCSRCWC